MEVLNQGAILVAGKLPYDNASLDRFAYTQYTFGSDLRVLSSVQDVYFSEDPIGAFMKINGQEIKDLVRRASDICREMDIPWDGLDWTEIPQKIEWILSSDVQYTQDVRDIVDRVGQLVQEMNSLSGSGSFDALFFPEDCFGTLQDEELESISTDFTNGMIGYLKDSCTFKFE